MRSTSWLFDGKGGAPLVVMAAILLTAAALIAFRIDATPRTEGSSATIDTLYAENGPLVVFRALDSGSTDHRLAVVPLSDPTRQPVVFNPACDRIAASANHVVCLGRSSNPLLPYQATLYGSDLKPIVTTSVEGLPSRVRISPAENYFATTGFVAGDSYSAELFSTRTYLFPITADRRGIGEGDNSESYQLIVNGSEYTFGDKNIWGITFVPDQQRFFATASFNGRFFLVDANIAERRMVVLRENAECPSLSPNGLMLAYKKRTVHGQNIDWRFHVLDLLTNEERALGETRSVDDQIAWIDDKHVLYAVRRDENSPLYDIWKAPVDGGPPVLFIPGGDSPTIVDRSSKGAV